MNFLAKLLVTNLVIISCAQLGRRYPALAGLIATMPITTLLVLFWLYSDRPGDYQNLVAYNRGVLFGIVPTILFFATSLYCFHRQLPVGAAVGAGFVAWLAGALVHQWVLR
ncbi:DUF3147 family protein [Geomesophilobacter sediminis]|uniref:DUF3147 family protein n=1 Tax=Geomesophilobacter sediminis TaxID=2798584 RepID=A0A8J7S8R4_9BACT|nr:DUF3147 family protein [Geomesophilobacter sediminis]MBJ6726591.1 DUF3147 family protein [Geomesophilobacter sediminis]